MAIKWEPHNYQLTAISFLISNPRSGLFLDPGLGKTSTSLATAKILINSGETKGILMIAPLRVTYSVWPSEIEKWVNFNGLTCTILHDDNKNSLWNSDKDIYLINPEGLPWLHKELLSGLRGGKKPPFNTLWVDESTKFKSHESKRFELLCDMLPLFKRRHIMTGTPSPKSLLDLWSQLYILDEGETLGHNFHKFRAKYFQSEDWDKYNWQIKDFSAEKIHELVAPMVLEMSATDYLDMPDLLYNNIIVTLPPKAEKHYKEMEKEFFIELDGMEASAEAAAQVSMKCHQIANGNVYEDIPDNLDEDEIKIFKRTRKTIRIHNAKLEALADLINELNGKPILIAYHFKHDLEALRGLLGDDVPYIGSGISPVKAKELEVKWNAGLMPILLGHPDAMAHGLNFQESGNDICWFSLTWNLENYIQFIARIWRQGVKGREVRVHHIIAKNTTDEAMMMRLGERAENQEDLRQALKRYRLRNN
jgi:SNF2 family DNA or RNA helicase